MSIRAQVVLPLVPVSAAIGTRERLPGGKSWSMIFAADIARFALGGAICMRRPGPALISQMAPPVSR